MAHSLEEQALLLVQLVRSLPPERATRRALAEVLAFVADIPRKFLPPELPEAIAATFKLPLAEAQAALNHAGRRTPPEDFEDLVPPSGWLRDYVEYTRQTEPPTPFHFFAGLTVLGATLARNVYFPRGSGNLFPNICTVLVAPPGRCKKTTACNLAVNLYRRVGGFVLADKITPEALVEAFKTRQSATGLIYAPEWSVFLGRQRYLEGLVPMLTALFDCPDIWSSGTVLRGDVQLFRVALSHLAATTPDSMQTSIMRDAFGGGFMSRLLFIVQHETPRSFPLPPPLDQKLARKLLDGLSQLQRTHGTFTLTPDARQWYETWYASRRAATPTERNLAGYFERKPDRLLQLAMVLELSADPHALAISDNTLRRADRLLSWLEHFLPDVFAELSATTVGDDQLRLLQQLRKAQGELGHSEWLRMNTNRMNAEAFRKCVETLQQARLIAFDPVKRRYYLLPAGEDVVQ
jgi:hypothetical protein